MAKPSPDVEIRNPCEERWEAMERRGEGRYCPRCERTVVDMTRMTRAQAEARMARARGRLCRRLAIDAETGAPLFRPEPSVAPRWTGGVVLAAALAGSGCGSRAEAGAPMLEAEAPEVVEADAAPPVLDGPPMEPVDTAAVAEAEAALVTGAVPAERLERPAETGEPTARQRRLTERKRRPASCALPSAQPQSRHSGQVIVLHELGF